MDNEKLPQETDAQKIERIEKALEEKNAKIKELETANVELSKKINSLRIDGLVKQVDTKVVQEVEDVEFDFDL